MRKLLFVSLLAVALLQSCECVQNSKSSSFCKCSFFQIYENDDTTRLMGLSSVAVEKRMYDKTVDYLIRVFVDNVDSTSFFYDFDDFDVQCLKEFLDSCSNNKLEYGESFIFEKNGAQIFNNDCFLLTFYCPTNSHYVDMRVSPQEFKRIIEKAEKYINDDKRKSIGEK